MQGLYKCSDLPLSNVYCKNFRRICVTYLIKTTVNNNVFKQVAQLWQTDRAKHALFSTEVHCYSQNHKIAFLGDSMGYQGHSWATEKIRI